MKFRFPIISLCIVPELASYFVMELSNFIVLNTLFLENVVGAALLYNLHVTHDGIKQSFQMVILPCKPFIFQATQKHVNHN